MLGFHLDPSPFFCRSEALSRAVGRCWVGRSIVEEFGRPVLEPEADPTEPKRGWQHRAARCLEERHLRRQVWPTSPRPYPRVGTDRSCDSCRPITIPGVVVQAPLSPTPIGVYICPFLFPCADVATYSMALGCWVGGAGGCSSVLGRQADVWVWTGSSVIGMWGAFHPTGWTAHQGHR